MLLSCGDGACRTGHRTPPKRSTQRGSRTRVGAALVERGRFDFVMRWMKAGRRVCGGPPFVTTGIVPVPAGYRGGVVAAGGIAATDVFGNPDGLVTLRARHGRAPGTYHPGRCRYAVSTARRDAFAMHRETPTFLAASMRRCRACLDARVQKRPTARHAIPSRAACSTRRAVFAIARRSAGGNARYRPRSCRVPHRAPRIVRARRNRSRGI